MTDFKELREALDRHAAVADPARLGEAAHIQYCRDAGVIQSWCRVDRLRVLLDRLEAAERDAERPYIRAELPPLPEWALRDDLGGLVPSEIRAAMRVYARAAVTSHEAAIDAMKEQQP